MRELIKLTAVIMLATANAASLAEPSPTPADYLAISRATGERLLRAGFDQANRLRWDMDSGEMYDPRIDTVVVQAPEIDVGDDAEAQRISAIYNSVPLAEHAAVFAAHEHCHAYLWKHRHHLPRAVRQAAKTCNVLPQAVGGRTFDELFCDMTSVVMVGESAKKLLLALRAYEDPTLGKADAAPDFVGHSYPLLRTAIMADKHERNPVQRVAHAVETACQTPAFQALRGQEERSMATKLSEELNKAMTWPDGGKVSVKITPIAELNKQQHRLLAPLSKDVGESIVLGFVGSYEACHGSIGKGKLPVSADAERAMARCGLTPVRYAQAFCSTLASDVSIYQTKTSFSYELAVRAVTDRLFGKDSFPSRLAQADYDFGLSIYSTRNTVRDISLRIEYACGAEPAELAEAVRLDRKQLE